MRNRKLFLTSGQLAKRWNMNAATLRQWRWFNKGPQFNKIGGSILYELEVIERFENELIRAHTTDERKVSVDVFSQLVSDENYTKK